MPESPRQSAVSVRALRFTEILGAQMRAEIIARGFSARGVAITLGMDPVTLHNYTSGRRIIPVTVLIDVCEVIGADGANIVGRSYDLLVAELGPPPPRDD